MRLSLLIIIFLAIMMVLAACSPSTPVSLDTTLADVLTEHNISPLDPGPTPEPAKVELGRVLYFDKVLSGNRDVSCATCHHPSLATADGIPLSIGTGGVGLGPERLIGYGRHFVPRHAPEIFNRGAPEWTTMFWDNRVSQNVDGTFISPADELLPAGLDNVLAVQAMFPVSSGAEMRGKDGDFDLLRQPNELGHIDSEQFTEIWGSLMTRLLVYPEYVSLFANAYPNMPANELNFQHAANAIAAFEIDAFTLLNSPWDRYLAGDESALSDQAKRGALLFYGDAGCANCHSGNLMSDQQPHNIAVPQIGPGKDDPAPLDLGRALETDGAMGRFAFRTPPLRNVTVTAPYMHNGAYSILETAVRHHLNPSQALRNYDPTEHLPVDLWGTYQNDDQLLLELSTSFDRMILPRRDLTEAELNDLLVFLEALTDPAVFELTNLTPEEVPQWVTSG